MTKLIIKKVNLDVKKRQRILIFFPVKEYAYYAATGKRYKYWYKYCIIYNETCLYSNSTILIKNQAITS